MNVLKLIIGIVLSVDSVTYKSENDIYYFVSFIIVEFITRKIYYYGALSVHNYNYVVMTTVFVALNTVFQGHYLGILSWT